MGWSSANQIFDPVARALIEVSASDDVKTRVLGKLIEQLQDGDWDTGDESLEEFADDPAIVAAFAANGIHLDNEDEETADSDSDVLALISEIASRLEDATDEGEYHAVGLIWELANSRKSVAEARAELAEITFRHV
jgi:hypothetical protein